MSEPEGSEAGAAAGTDRPPSTGTGDLAVPVVVRSPVGTQFGWVRRMSRQSAVIELEELPPLRSSVEVTFELLDGPDPAQMSLCGRVQHIMLWATGGARRRHRQVAVRWATSPFRRSVLH